MTDAHALTVGKAVGVHAPAMAEPWCVVASEEKVATRTLIGIVGVPFDGGVTNRPGTRHGRGICATSTRYSTSA